MNESIIKSLDYKSFRSSVPQRNTVVDGDVSWTFYDAGPRNIQNPIIFLPPVSGTADIYFRQLLSLSAAGVRALSLEDCFAIYSTCLDEDSPLTFHSTRVNHPVVWNVESWCRNFQSLLNSLGIDRVHLFGANLGGFLAQKFAEFSGNGRRVRSMILCNAFNDTDVFNQTTASASFWAVPAVMLKKLVMGNFDSGLQDIQMAQSIDFMVEKLDSLSQQELAARLTLNCHSSYVMPQGVQVIGSDITLMNVFDEHALSSAVNNEMSKMYPGSRKALLKTGGNFPYLSRSDEVNIYIQVHLQQFADTIYSASEPKEYPQQEQTPPQASAQTPEQEESDEETGPLISNIHSKGLSTPTDPLGIGVELSPPAAISPSGNTGVSNAVDEESSSSDTREPSDDMDMMDKAQELTSDAHIDPEG